MYLDDEKGAKPYVLAAFDSLDDFFTDLLETTEHNIGVILKAVPDLGNAETHEFVRREWRGRPSFWLGSLEPCADSHDKGDEYPGECPIEELLKGLQNSLTDAAKNSMDAFMKSGDA